jgi:hypothetical protein
MKHIPSPLPHLLMVPTAVAKPSKNIVLSLADDRMAQRYAITGNNDDLALAKRFNHERILPDEMVDGREGTLIFAGRR